MLSAMSITIENEVEPNDTQLTATVLPLTEDPSGSGLWLGRGLGRQDPAQYQTYYSDPDYWQVELQAGDWLTVAVDTPDSNVDPYVEVQNAAGGGLAGDDDSGPNSDALVSHTAITSDGLYYIKVGKNYYSTVVGKLRGAGGGGARHPAGGRRQL